MIRYEELGSTCISGEQNHPITICAVKPMGTDIGNLYIKGSFYALRNFFSIRLSKDYEHLKQLESKYQKIGLFPMVYCVRDLTPEDTKELFITINEGT